LNEASVPLIIIRADGSVAALTQTNPKAVAKSIERGELWFFHPGTGRVLPWDGGGSGFARLMERRGSDSGAASAESEESAESAPVWYEAHLAAEGNEPVAASGEGAAATRAGADATAVAADVPEGFASRVGSAFEHLTQVIAERKRTMPEGSYTTHLFRKGPEKIRKKTGEEAVELILAREPDELRYEAADLIYHLLVLLEAEGESFLSIIDELESRS